MILESLLTDGLCVICCSSIYFNIWWNLNVDLEDPVKNADNVVKDLCSSNLHGHQSLFFKYLSGVYPASMFIVTQNNQVL